MKKTSLLLSLTALAAMFAAGCASTATSSSDPAPTYTPVDNASAGLPANVAVSFHDPDRFTDARSSFGGATDHGYLDMLSAHLKRTAAPLVKADQKLEVTFTDVDLAGDFQPSRVQLDDVRIIKEIYRPRMTLHFKLTGADGTVVKEGDRTLSDSYFMTNISIVDRNDPLFYDKELIANWVRDEFKS